MTNLARQAARRLGQSPLVTDLLAKDDEALSCAAALGALWTAGCPVELPVSRPAGPVLLPGYPFAATRYWLDARPAEVPGVAGSCAAPAASLPAAPEPGPEVPGQLASAGTEVAAVVTRVWQSAFGGEPLQPTDNFFTLGGTSLQAAQLIAVVNDELLLSARLHDIYEFSTLADFIARIDALTQERDDAELLRLLEEIESEGAAAGDE
jgi:acyl transferase domain-containing protein